MTDPELVKAYGLFIMGIAFAACLILTPFAVVIGNYYTKKEDIADYVNQLAEHIRALDIRIGKLETQKDDK